MKGFLGVERIDVPSKCIRDTHAHLAAVGRQRNEGFVLWIGEPTGSTFKVTEALIPNQRGLHIGGGVCVTVDGHELHRINVLLSDSSLRLIAQVHSHPTDAYHSDTDDAYPIATTMGCLSLVVPDFARRPFSLRECAIYRLSEDARWVELDNNEKHNLIKVES